MTVTNTSYVDTYGALSAGITGLSVAGSGGVTGFALTPDATIGTLSGPIFHDQGKQGGHGGTTQVVTVTNGKDSEGTGEITTRGFGATGTAAQSVAGNGGAGGIVHAGILDATQPSLSLSTANGAGIGNGGTAGAVTVSNDGHVTTSGTYAYGILASSVGRSGGSVVASYQVTNPGQERGSVNAIDVVSTLGSGGSTGGRGGDVTVASSGQVRTSGVNAHGIWGQSVGGNGGASGTAITYLLDNYWIGGGLNVGLSVGAEGGSGAVGGAVSLDNAGGVTTGADTSYGLYAQSIGGSGGDAGNFGTVFAGYTQGRNVVSDTTFNLSVTVGGEFGGTEAGGTGGAVTVNNRAGATVTTAGAASYGIFAQSIGGNGGNAGNGRMGTASSTAVLANAPTDVDAVADVSTYSVKVTGTGGAAAATGGAVTVTNDGAISTKGASGTAIFAQSVGGGGGNAGDGSGELMTDFSLEASSGGGGAGGAVSVDGAGSITTTGDGAMGIFAQSVGGGGGTVGDFEVLPDMAIDSFGKTTFGAGALGGGNGGAGGDGGRVTVALPRGGSIATSGRNAHGIWAQSVGGGGGAAARTKYVFRKVRAAGSWGNAGDSGLVELDIDGTVSTTGAGSMAVFAQSVSGGASSSVSGGVLATISGTVTAGGANARAILSVVDGTAAGFGNSGVCASKTTTMCRSTTHITVEEGAVVRTTDRAAYETIGIYGGLQSFRSNGAIYASNLISNAGTIASADPYSLVIGTPGDAALRIFNNDGGVISGSIDLTQTSIPGGNFYSNPGMRNQFENRKGAVFEPGQQVNLGSLGHYKGLEGSTIRPFGNDRTGSSTFYLGGSYSEKGTFDVNLRPVASGVANDRIIFNTGRYTPTVTFAARINPVWIDVPTGRTRLSGRTDIAFLTGSGTFDASGATVVDTATVDYSLDSRSERNALFLNYRVDFSGALKGTRMQANAQEYATYFTNALAGAQSDQTTRQVRKELRALALTYLNATSAEGLEDHYLSVVPEEALIATSAAVQAALTMQGRLNSCPQLDPKDGLAFLQQRDCAWIRGITSNLTQDETDQTPGYSERAGGFAGAVQREIAEDIFLEFGGAYEGVSVSGESFSQSGERYALGAALKKEIGRYTLSFGLAGGVYSFDQNRSYAQSGTTRTASAKVKGNFLSMEARASGVFQKGGGLYLKPVGALTLTRVWQDGFTESGTGSMNWDVAGTANTAVDFTPSLEIGQASTFRGRSMVSYLRGGVTMALTDPTYGMSSVLVGGDAGLDTMDMTLSGERYRGNLAAGVDMDLGDKLTLSLAAEAGLTQSSRAYGGSVRLEFRF
ncbi:autotransporter outer membrane beta-barrel domain-containing protein [Chachezhania sediminis]|uniref:autotransporter outer membrane beta-barrel domain-containing protein n=1 Tax=Chachezhania sediminis TaxID=2599291 RepID=UPI00131C2968|nr:autotransporter outer membrane beta-barrel domain-containing protein [Chachezhania sediminis]